MSPPYLDTSALAKWYLNEPGSEDFEAFITQQAAAAISRLTVVEMRCLLGRRRRDGSISSRVASAAFRLFEDDVRRGHLEVHPLVDGHAVSALSLLDRLRRQPLRTLDALHLAVALELKAPVIATADRVMARAAAQLGLEVVAFG